MKICIYGAGAIGGYLGVQLALAGQDVSLVARGPHLAAIKEHGLKLRIDGEERVANITATDNPADLGPQDPGQAVLDGLPGLLEVALPGVDERQVGGGAGRFTGPAANNMIGTVDAAVGGQRVVGTLAADRQ